MMIRQEVKALLDLGPLPDEQAAIEDAAKEEVVKRADEALRAIGAPVSREEAELLIGAFGTDGCFGLAWALLHLIESAPGGAPIDKEPPPDANEWVRDLWARKLRGAE